MQARLALMRSGLALVLLGLAVGSAVRAADPPPHPNLVILLADDLGWNDVGYHGSEIRTPRIDKLAAEGVQLDQFYALQECTPARAALMTGRHPIRYGLQDGVFWPWNKVGLSLKERTLPQALREAGYATVMIGKWHLGIFEPAYLPMARGFDRHYGGPYTGLMDYFQHRYYALDWHRDGHPLVEEGYATELLGREAVRVVQQHDFAKPLFLYLAFSAPHAPLQAPPEFVQPYAAIEDENRRTYAGMVAALDEQIGHVLDALAARGVLDKTLVLFASDNGGSPPHGGSNDPLRGIKSELWEGGIRVPAVASWSGVLPAGSVLKQPLHITDVYPTLLHLAGANREQPLALDGFDVWGALARGEPTPRKEMLINALSRQSAVRVGDWKLVRTNQPGAFSVELFDLSKDPIEKHDLSRQMPQKVEELEARLAAYQAQAVPALGPYPLNLPFGYQVPKAWGDPN